MIQIGKIVHKEKLINHKPLSYIIYQNLTETSRTPLRLPTLIVGWKLANELFPYSNLDILERDINVKQRDKYLWEFSPTEDIIQYSSGLEFFVKRLPYLFISRYDYKNADPFFHNLFTLDQINGYLPDGGSLYVYKNEIAYYLSGNTIYGLKLAIYDYMTMNVQSIVNMLVSKSKNHFIDDSTEYQKYYKMFPEFGYLKRSMVVFLFP